MEIKHSVRQENYGYLLGLFCAFLLMVLPVASNPYWPNFFIIIIFYSTLITQKRFQLTAFWLMAIFYDLLVGSYLIGQSALIYSLIAGFIYYYQKPLSYSSPWQQAWALGGLTFLANLMYLFFESLDRGVFDLKHVFIPAIFNIIIWWIVAKFLLKDGYE